MHRFFQWLLIAALLTGATLGIAQGERFPSKPIQVVIMSTPGSASGIGSTPTS